MLDKFTKKESPILGYAGFGGGVSNLLTLASGTETYLDDVFSTYVYKGTGASRTITNGIDLAGEGGLVWVKKRTGSPSEPHVLTDTERGSGRWLQSNADTAEYGNGSGGPVSAFNSDGFVIDDNGNVNASGEPYVSWAFRKAPGFFDVVTFTGTGSAQSIAHSLGSVPGMVVVKNRSNSGHWVVNHISTGAGTGRMFLNLSNESSTGSATAYWNSTAPTSTHFTVGADSNVNANGDTFVAYIFAHNDGSFGENADEAVIKCGTYTGNGTSQVINLGFEAQWVVVKCTNDTGQWYVFDVIRDMTVTGGTELRLDADGTPNRATTNFIGPSPNGFTANGNGGGINYNNDEFAYIAIRRSHKPPSAGTEVFSVDDQSSGSGGGGVSFSAPSFPIDLMITKRASSNADWKVLDRLRGYDKCLITNDNSAESTESYLAGFDQNSGYTVGSNGGVLNESDTVTWCFKRAKGFFDMVAYTGTGSARTINHNLGAVPQMIWVKKRNTSESWSVYSATAGATKNHWINDNGGAITHDRWNDTAPTDSVFSVKTDGGVNASGSTYIAYLFGSDSGVSKVGSYTGTGSDGINVNCGFAAGARFVMIKRTDGNGNWFVWDSTRGIASGNDPYTAFNTNAAQVTNTDYIDPLNAGFIVNGSAESGLNANGGTYLFLAIA